MTLSGFAELLSTCRELGLRVSLRPPALALLNTRNTLGSELDPDLAAFFGECDGGQLWQLDFDACSDAAPQNIVSDNRSARSLMDQPITEQLVLFAQYGHQAAHLCCVPAITSGGFQCVVFADLHEAPIIKPIASRVDRAFVLISGYLRRLARAGLRMDETASELTFPDAVVDLIAEDNELVALLASSRFAALATHEDSRGFVDKVLRYASGTPDSGHR